MPDEYISSKEMRERGYDRNQIAHEELLEEGRKEARALIAEIERVFVNIPRPMTTLHVGRALDDEWVITVERATELRALDPEEDWKEIEDEKLENFTEIFAFGDDGSTRFYLPAWMRKELRYFCDGGHSLDNWGGVYWTITNNLQLKQLTKEERTLTQRYVDMVHKYDIWP